LTFANVSCTSLEARVEEMIGLSRRNVIWGFIEVCMVSAAPVVSARYHFSFGTRDLWTVRLGVFPSNTVYVHGECTMAFIFFILLLLPV